MRLLMARTAAVLVSLLIVLLVGQRLWVMAYWETHPIAHEEADQYWAYKAVQAKKREAAAQAESERARLEKERQEALKLPPAQKEFDPSAVAKLLDMRQPPKSSPPISK